MTNKINKMQATNNLVAFTSAAVLAVSTSMVGGCSSTEPPGVNEVFMRNIAFDPPEITINVGESVTWTNLDIVSHTATSGSPEDVDFGSVFVSALMGINDTFTHTFDEPGEFIYFCETHPVAMRDAKVIVQAP